MKTLTIFAVALLSAGVVFADAASAQTTRAQVVSELAQARASGELDRLNSDQPAFFTARTGSTKTRAQVQAELAQAQASGELAALNSEDSSRFFLNNTATASTKTRAQVLAELKESQQSGEFAALHSEDLTAIQRFAAQKAAKHVETLAE